MTDLLFIELGAIVAEIKGPAHCTIEPFCETKFESTFDSGNRFEVDFAQLLDNLLLDHGVADAAQLAQYDQIVAPMAGRRVPIGPSWPGGGYEGILCVRDDVVRGNNLLAQAANKLAGPRCRYQVIASVAADKTIRRYHGFPAEVIGSEGGVIKFRIVNHDDVITYDPTDSNAAVKFYTGNLVAENVISGAGLTQGQIGPVFMNLDEFTTSLYLDEELPKLPPSAGL